MEKVGMFFGHLEYITPIWYILWHFDNLWQFGIFPPILVHCEEKNLATLSGSPKSFYFVSRVARFFLVQYIYKKGENIPNDHNIYRMAIKYTKWP
jgi:hypothetical protein